jgi:hypothetical protein
MRTPSRGLVAALLVLAFAASLAPPGASGGTDETIGVRGHWVIEVRDPGGAPVMRREFHNALAVDNPITRFLTGQKGPGSFTVRIIGDTLACGSVGPIGLCFISDSRGQVGATGSAFRTLTVSSGADGLQLRGSAVVSSESTIARVETFISTCEKNLTPVNCAQFNPLLGSPTTPAPLTSAVLSPGIDVHPGQQVLITVIITAATATASPTTTSQSVAPSR